jgi:tetratricopeptide (TPR) repeat protein
MSPSRTLSIGVFLAACLLAPPLLASTGELPITTTSPEARRLFVQAMDKADNLELQAALKLVDQAIASDPEFAMAYLLRANVVASFSSVRENVDKAVSLVDKVSPGERNLILASKAQSDGDMTGTKLHLDALATEFPNDKRVILQLGRFQRLLGNERQASVLFRKATTLDPSFAPAFNDLGYARMALGDFRSAETAFKKYIVLLPKSPNPYDSYAEMLMKAGRYDESIAQYRKALEEDPGFVASMSGIGMNQVFKKNYAEARKTFEAQREKAPDLDGQLDALENIATSHVDEGNADKAVEVYGDVASRAMEGHEPLRAIGAELSSAFVLSARGNAQAAAPHVAKADEILGGASLPESVKSRQASRIDLVRAQVHAAGGQFDEARATLEKAKAAIEQREIPGEKRRLNTAMGTVALKEKKYADALAFLKKGDDQDPYTLYQRAVAQAGLGQRSQAAALFATVAKSNVNNLGYALVRQEAMAQSSLQPVATAGRKK